MSELQIGMLQRIARGGPGGSEIRGSDAHNATRALYWRGYVRFVRTVYGDGLPRCGRPVYAITDEGKLRLGQLRDARKDT